MRVNGTSGGTLANDSYNSSYDNAKEKSWQVRHDYNFVALGVPGLTLMNRYISGDNVHTGTITDGKEWGRESELAYTVQSGPLKNLNVKWRNASIRGTSAPTSSTKTASSSAIRFRCCKTDRLILVLWRGACSLATGVTCHRKMSQPFVKFDARRVDKKREALRYCQ
jgi:hypothetical protein